MKCSINFGIGNVDVTASVIDTFVPEKQLHLFNRRAIS